MSLGIGIGLGLTLNTGAGAPVLIGVMGQSNERGSCKKYVSGLTTDPNSYAPIYFTSSRKPSVADPIPLSVTGYGSWWPLLVDYLWARGKNATIVNGAVGSLAFINQACGQIRQWVANASFYQKRTSEGTGDNGDKGDIIRISDGSCFRCTVGTKRYATLTGASPAVTIAGTPYSNLDYVLFDTAKLSGSVQPTWSNAPNVGDTITDGAITWTRLNAGNSGYSVGTIWSSVGTAVWGTSEFDPLGVLGRLKARMDASPIANKWLFLSNGQSDAQGSSGVQTTIRGWYSAALQNLAAWGRAQGYKVAIGFTCDNPTDETNGVGYRWSAGLDPGWDDACTAVVDGVNIIRGANLYRALGLNPAVYPETGFVPGVHLTDVSLPLASAAWRDALIAAGW